MKRKRRKNVSTSLPSYDSPNHWKPHSATWENAQAFKTYWKKKVTALGRNFTPVYEKYKVIMEQAEQDPNADYEAISKALYADMHTVWDIINE